jgi:alkylation response protein AidB-like acyl-CoA dehydrogenase
MQIAKCCQRVLGGYALIDEPSEPVPDAPRWFNLILNGRMLTIAGGTNEIQHNILGELST